MSLTREQRKVVSTRAGECCEYCRIPYLDRLIPFHVDHIIPLRHEGADEIENLCLACYSCNINKGYNIAALDPDTGTPVQLFNPRRQKWDDHFIINDNCTIRGLTDVGRTTANVLKFNDANRVTHRRTLLESGFYPCPPKIIL
jgi:HNH endonuclease